jgi:plastocyanin domain-containing protein
MKHLGSSFAIALLFAACQKSAPVAPPLVTPPPAAPAAAPAKAEVKDRVEVTITEEGFVPSTIPAKAGQPLTLVLTRKAERTCATEILFQGQEGKTDLPLNKTVEVVYTPKQSGKIRFGCAMGMMVSGVLEVRD